MITIKDFTEAINFKITGGSEYQWHCFGSNARWLDSEDSSNYSASIIFDGITQTVYQADVCDYINNRAYRWEHPDYAAAHLNEARERKINYVEAWEKVDYTLLEVEEDFLEKCTAIASGNFDYDTKVSVPLTLGDDELFQLMKMAHEDDITLNQLVEKVLRQAMNLQLDL